MPLVGVHQHTLGPNGRIIIPAKLRADLGEDFVAVAAFDRLQLFPMHRWLQIEDRIRARNPLSDSTMELLEYLGENSAVCSQDKQGRCTVPAELLARVGLTDEITSLGAVDRVQVWPKDRYEARRRKGEADLRDLFDKALS